MTGYIRVADLSLPLSGFDAIRGLYAEPPMMTDEEWAAEREAATQKLFGVSVEEFVIRFEAGQYDGDTTGKLCRVLMLFPELD